MRSPAEAREAMAFAQAASLPAFILGGGSNILVSDHGFDGLVIHPALKGLELLHEDADTVLLQAGAAETWEDVIAYTVAQGWLGHYLGLN